MKARPWWLMSSLVVAFSVACGGAATPVNTEADVAAINAVREREMGFVNSGNPDSLSAVYASDVIMMPPNEPAVNGRDAVRQWAQTAFGQVTMSVRYTNTQVTVAGDWAVDRYTGVLTVTPKAGGAPMEEQIKGVHVMRREADGSWSIAQDVWNSDAAPPPPAPAVPAKK